MSTRVVGEVQSRDNLGTHVLSTLHGDVETVLDTGSARLVLENSICGTDNISSVCTSLPYGSFTVKACRSKNPVNMSTLGFPDLPPTAAWCTGDSLTRPLHLERGQRGALMGLEYVPSMRESVMHGADRKTFSMVERSSCGQDPRIFDVSIGKDLGVNTRPFEPDFISAENIPLAQCSNLQRVFGAPDTCEPNHCCILTGKIKVPEAGVLDTGSSETSASIKGMDTLSGLHIDWANHAYAYEDYVPRECDRL